MAKKLITLKVHMRCLRCRTKALKTAAEAYGVTAVRLEGEDRVVVEGYGVEIRELAHALKKKVGYTEILLVFDV